MSHRSRLCALFLLVLLIPTAAAENRTIRYSFSSLNPEAQLEDVLYYALGIEFSNAGYSSSKTDSSASFRLAVSYENRGDSAGIELVLATSDGGTGRLASVTANLPYDDTFDAQISYAVKRLLEAASLNTGGTPASPAAISGLFSSDLVRAQDMLRTDRTLRLEVVAGPGASAYLGDFAEYANFGAFGFLQASMLFLRPERSLSLGGRASSSWVFLGENITGGPLLLSTFGVNVQIGVGSSQRLRFAGCASGGGAVISVRSGDSFLSKTDPYADAGVQFGFPVMKDLFVGADVRGLVIFDRDILIYGTILGIALAREF